MEVGLYGKLPTHGDFLRRRVADDFITGWDPWLQECIAHSRTTLGEHWLETYLTSPVWRFALMPQVCGSAAVAGILVPSVDRVGRYFPLTLVWPTPAEMSTLQVALKFRDGFEHAERLLLDTLAAEHFEFAAFDRSVMDLAMHFEDLQDEDLRLTSASATKLAVAKDRPRCVPLRDAAALAAPALQLLGELLDADGAAALFWTDGSAAVEPSWLITRGLPRSSQYSAMLDGAWASAGWELGEVQRAIEPDFAATLVHMHPLDALTVTSGAHSDRGSVRSSNQDSFIERPDLRLWAVADGMGGLRDGDVASRMVCDSLAAMPTAGGLDEQIEAVIEQLRAVNTYLRRSATRDINPVHSGSTVVVMLIRELQGAIVWAGDSRAYRLRDGVLAQLTRDHAWDPGETGENDQGITRAVGGEATLSPETVRCDVQAGDRFLLCSDGIYRALDHAMLGQLLQEREPARCSKELALKAMAAGGTDNVTAIVIDCGTDGATHD